MAYSDSLAFDYEMKPDIIIIQSCFRDARHNELIQNSENITLLDDHLTFNLGDSFDCFEALKSRLDAHSQQSNIHYWMRDSRTVVGALMKTTRRIEPRLKYYNVKYACVYGGHKPNPRGQGKRNCVSMRLNCPAHITLRANRTGERLEVVSVCNHHNHTISPDIYQHMRRHRLSAQLKQEVLDLLKMGIVKQRVLDYVRWQSGNVLTYKDIINMAAAAQWGPSPTQQRREALFEALKRAGLEHRKSASEHRGTDQLSSEIRKRRRKSTSNKQTRENKKSRHSAGTLAIKEEPSAEKRTPRAAAGLDATREPVEGRTDTDVDVDREVEIHYEEENPDSIAESNIMNYLYQTDCDGEPVITIMNQDDEMVSLEPIDSSGQYLIPPGEVTVRDSGADYQQTFGELQNQQDVTIVEDIPGISAEDVHILSTNEIILEETWISNDNITYINGDIVGDIEQRPTEIDEDVCSNCEKIKSDLNNEVNTLKRERRELEEEMERLRRERDGLLLEVKRLKEKEVKSPRTPIVLKKGRQKFYIVKM